MSNTPEFDRVVQPLIEQLTGRDGHPGLGP